jgi:thiosulfate/3-mercaptopyruvate sulfurtransferase
MMALMGFGPLVSAAWLAEHLGEPDLRVVDCRWRLRQPGAGEREWLAGHIPGAAFLDLDSELSDPPGRRGRHPLPSAERFDAAARRAGISAATRVVAYDLDASGGAARLWWLLRHFGHEQAAVLDGGFAAWHGSLEGGDVRVEPGDFTARPRSGDTADADEIAAQLGDPSLVLLDARSAARYEGREEPVDTRAGHIPGALSLPVSDVAPGGSFMPAAGMRERLPDGELVAYCGSGVSACNLVLAAELAGRPARLYPGSWSEWCARGLPAAPRPSAE